MVRGRSNMRKGYFQGYDIIHYSIFPSKKNFFTLKMPPKTLIFVTLHDRWGEGKIMRDIIVERHLNSSYGGCICCSSSPGQESADFLLGIVKSVLELIQYAGSQVDSYWSSDASFVSFGLFNFSHLQAKTTKNCWLFE